MATTTKANEKKKPKKESLQHRLARILVALGIFAVVFALDELGVDRGRAKWFLTHFHLDHAGLIDRVVPEGAPLFMGGVELGEARVTRTGVFLDALTRTYRQQGVALSDATTAARLGVEQPLFDPQRLRTAFVRGGDTVTVGGLTLTVMHTPGHTPGSSCYIGDGVIFSGDTLFAGGAGRTDFPGGDEAALRRSLKRLAALEGDYRVFPGHEESTTLQRERLENPYVNGFFEE